MSQLSTRAAFLINSIISCAAAANSEYPMKALKARQRMEKLRTELEEYITNVENPAMTLFTEPTSE